MKKPIEDVSLIIKYNSWNTDILVENRRLRHVETEYEFDNPINGIPSGSREVVRTDSELTTKQWEDLRHFVDGSGFDALEDTYGAPEGARFYPYTLDITLGEGSKRVTIRSNPDFEGAPEAFQSIEQYLFDLSKRLREAVSDDLYVMYDSSDDDIEIASRHIKHVRTQFEFANPVSAVPTGSRAVELVDSDLTPAEHEELVSFIRDCGFDSLAPAYGAPVDRRHYAYVLTIGFGNERKMVSYRSNPSYETAPEAFRRVEEYVLELSRRVRSRLSG